jgi:AcrR family transcriptional regulator
MALEETPNTARATLPARERILDTAYELFSHNGLRVVGIERLIDESGVAKKTFYRHFPSKQDLMLAFLGMRGQRWTSDWLLADIDELAATPRDRSLALFDALDEWFHRDDYESDAFTCALLEMRGKADPVHQEAAHQLEVIRELLQDHAQQAGVRDPEAVGYQMQILMIGAIVAATRGDLDAARRAREVAELILDRAR